MSKIRLHGTSSGYTEIAPVAASGNNTLTLPNDGTIISKDSNGAVGVTSVTVGTGVKLTSTTTVLPQVKVFNSSTPQIRLSTDTDDSSDNDRAFFGIATGSNNFVNGTSSGDTVVRAKNSGKLLFGSGTTETAEIDSSSNLKFNSGYGSVATAFGVRAWLKMYWNSGTPTISGSGNVSSLTDVATGDFTINLTTALPDTVYATCVSGDEYGQSAHPSFNTGFTSRGYTTSAITVNATNASGSSTDIKSVQVIVVR